MAPPAKLDFRPLSARETAERLGISRSRADEITRIVDSSGAEEHPSQDRSHSASASSGYTFRCSDVGYNDCPWQTQGSNMDEVLRKAEQHEREHHRITEMDESTRNKVRNNIRRYA